MRLEKKERLSVGINAEQILSSFSSVCRFWVASQWWACLQEIVCS